MVFSASALLAVIVSLHPASAIRDSFDVGAVVDGERGPTGRGRPATSPPLKDKEPFGEEPVVAARQRPPGEEHHVERRHNKRAGQPRPRGIVDFTDAHLWSRDTPGPSTSGRTFSGGDHTPGDGVKSDDTSGHSFPGKRVTSDDTQIPSTSPGDGRALAIQSSRSVSSGPLTPGQVVTIRDLPDSDGTKCMLLRVQQQKATVRLLGTSKVFKVPLENLVVSEEMLLAARERRKIHHPSNQVVNGMWCSLTAFLVECSQDDDQWGLGVWLVSAETGNRNKPKLKLKLLPERLLSEFDLPANVDADVLPQASPSRTVASDGAALKGANPYQYHAGQDVWAWRASQKQWLSARVLEVAQDQVEFYYTVQDVSFQDGPWRELRADSWKLRKFEDVNIQYVKGQHVLAKFTRVPGLNGWYPALVAVAETPIPTQTPGAQRRLEVEYTPPLPTLDFAGLPVSTSTENVLNIMPPYDRSRRLYLCQDEEKPAVEGLFTFLDKARVSSCTAAAEKLNAEPDQIKGGYCAVWSTAESSWFVLWRGDRQESAREQQVEKAEEVLRTHGQAKRQAVPHPFSKWTS